MADDDDPPGDGYEPGSSSWLLGAAHGSFSATEAERPVFAERNPVQLLALQHHLHGATSVPDLFTRASRLARLECGFARAVVLSVEDGLLRADGMSSLEDAGSDMLRRHVLADPVRLIPGSLEAELIRIAEGGRGAARGAGSVLREAQGLEHFALGVVMPEDRVLALVVVDRPDPPVTPTEHAAVQGFTQLVTCSLERVVTRQRVGELASEVRYMTASTSALLGEALASPIALPVQDGAALVFRQAGNLGLPVIEDLHEVFTRREVTIVRLLIEGESNRGIAEALHLSQQTVKKYVSRVMRKVGASNRADAAVRCLRLLEATQRRAVP